ncbi:hypothetical protein K449DRAFT_2434 [Hypoxylon sp. EC38]|nr:hypothetical protein K449DRAFT_2434 [Hypoxylon sp. EC38]
MSGVGEALAVPSAIAGLLSLGIEVAKALYAVADGIGTAGEEVREVASEVSQYTRTTEAIQDVLKRQEHVAHNIMAMIERLVRACQPIFQTYHSLQKGLAPLLERFRNSKKKLDQVGLRLMWYLRTKKKVYGCRSALQRQFALLTPILTALSIDQRANTTQSNSYVHHVQVKVMLENSAASVELQHRRDRRERLHYTIEQQRQALLVAVGDASKNKTASEGIPKTQDLIKDGKDEGADTSRESSTTAASGSQSALVRYQSPNTDEEDLSPEDIGDIDREVEEAFDIGLESVVDGDIEEIVLETYSVEKQFLLLIQQILAGLSARARNTQADSRDVNPRDVTGGSHTPELKDPKQQFRDVVPVSDPGASDTAWTTLVKPDGTSYKFPYEELTTDKGIVAVLGQMGYKDRYGYQDFGYDYNIDGIMPRDLEWTLRVNHIQFIDSDGAIILPRFLTQTILPGMKVQFKSTDQSVDEGHLMKKHNPLDESKGLLRRLFRSM